MRRIAVLTVHSCPLAALGGKETGGMNVYVRELSRQMGRLGNQVDVFTRSQNPHISTIAPLGRNARVVHIKAGPEEPVPKNDLFGFLPEFLSGVVRFAEEQGRPFDVVHSHYWLSGCVGAKLKERWSLPLFNMFHTLGALKDEVLRGRPEREPKRRMLMERRIMGVADGLIAPNPWEREQMILQNAPPSKVRVIPCGVDLDLFRPIASFRAKKHLGLSQRDFILYVGRIDAVKDIDVLIRAFHALIQKPVRGGKELGLIILGGEVGEEQGQSREMRELRKMAVQMGLQDRVAFWGAQRQDLLPYFYSAAEALVLPSRYESFGMVALEAMACGTPVIASRVGGLQYTVEDGRSGLLFPEGDWRVLASCIREAVEDRVLRKKLFGGAQARARQYGWARIARTVLSFYDDAGGAL
ncbi:MAG TPA: glycosyltransferase [Thermodesulfobacteriota bacterium]|nr:glycosyltransferase [Thermodesulfobacteriota bacterium]